MHTLHSSIDIGYVHTFMIFWQDRQILLQMSTMGPIALLNLVATLEYSTFRTIS